MIDGCPVCKVCYKLRDGDIPHQRLVSHSGSQRPDEPRAYAIPSESFVVYWEFTCPACGFVQRILERDLAERFKEDWPEDASTPLPGHFYDWIEELGR